MLKTDKGAIVLRYCPMCGADMEATRVKWELSASDQERFDQAVEELMGKPVPHEITIGRRLKYGRL